MPANVETAAFANQPAWHREGVVLDTNGEKGLTIGVALKESGLDWEVAKVPVYGAPSYKKDENGLYVPDSTKLGDAIERKHGVLRLSDQKMLGVVGDTWQPVQNSEGFKVIQDFMQGDTAYIEAAGALDGGRKVWVLAHMAEDMQIAGEDISRYVLFTNGHDGRTSVTAAMTDIRVVCQNTLDWALSHTNRIVRVRHTNKATDRLAQAKQILGIRDKYSEELAKQGEWLVESEMTDKQFNNFLEKLMPIPEEQEGKPAETMIRNRRDQVRDVYAKADNLNNVRGTKWGALNAVVEYVDHRIERKTDEAQVKAQFGLTPTPLKDAAATLLLADAPKKVVAPV